MDIVKNVYQTDTAVNLYNNTHYLPPDYKNKKLDILIKYIKPDISSDENDCLMIADIGIGQGDILIPFIEKIRNKFKQKCIKILGIDNSDLQLEKLRTNLTNAGYKCSNNDNLYKLNNNVEITLLKNDIEDNEVFTNISQKYDIIFIDYVLHHLLNWRIGIFKVLNILKSGGSLVFSNRLKDIEFLDGNFKNFNEKSSITNKKNFYDFLKKYYFTKRKYFYWDPEIRATDYSEVFNVLKPLFKDSKNENIYQSYGCSLKSIKEWIQNKSLTHFWVGDMPPGEITHLFEQLETTGELFTLDDGEKVYILNGFNNKLSKLDLNFTNYLLKIVNARTERGPNISQLSQVFIDMSVTHDIIFADKTYFLGFHPWDILENKWEEPFRVVFNKNIFLQDLNKFKSFILSYFLYLKIITSFDFSINEYLFLLQKYKFNFKVKLLNNITEITEKKIFDDENIIKEVELSIPVKYKINSPYFSDLNIDNIYDYIITKETPIKSGLVGLDFDILLIEDLFYKFPDLNNAIKDFYETNDYKQFNYDIKSKNNFYIFSGITPENKDKLIKAIFAIISFFLEEDCIISYLPSKVISSINEEEDKNDIGFGGVILLEKIQTSLVLNNGFKKFFSKLEKKRNEALLISNQLIFSRIAVYSWAKKNNYNLKLHATKSAIAAIMSRNMSHNLGSHVLSYASVNLNHPFDIQVLLEYMQERMDFIAQITSDWPQWSMPMHFVGQLMRNFYKQRILLNYIAESEGLKAKEYKLDTSDENRLQIIVLDKDGKEIVPDGDRNKTKGSDSSINNTKQNGGNTFKDPIVAIPGGITGAHAFYTILENVIRNAAKHSFTPNPGNEGLKIFVQIDNTDNEKVTVCIFDNVSKNVNYNSQSNLLTKIQDIIKQSIIKDDGSLENKNWGIAEIKIGAGFLQKVEQLKIGSKTETPDFSKVITLKKENEKYDIDNNPNENSLIGYQFDIPKPKYVLIICEKDNLKNINKELNKYGVYVKGINDIPKGLKLDYEFVLYPKNIDETFKTNFPQRSFEYEKIEKQENGTTKISITVDKSDEITNGNKITLDETLREKLYKLWIKKLLNGKGNNICLEVSPFEESMGGGGVSNIKAYKYSVETLLKSLSEETDAYGIFKDFLNNEKSDIVQDLYKKLIKQDKQMIPKLIDKKSSVVEFFKKYEEDIETLPEYFKESKEKSSEDCKKYYFDGDSLQEKEEKDNDCNNAIVKIKYKRHASGKIGDDYYVEALSGSQSYFTEIANFVKNKTVNKNAENKKTEINIFAYSLIETGLLGITVVDERVFEFYNSNPDIAKRFDAVNIFVAESLSNLNDSNEKPVKDILIVHQGIIDKGDQSILNDIKDNYQYRYITSGSGDKKPSAFEGFKFIPFSNVRSALMRQYPEKYILIQSLMKI